MAKKVLKLFAILFASIFLFTACNFTPLKGGPEENAAVYGNGGLAVVKGDYVYFANGYTSATSVESEKDNEFGDISYSALFRAKLNNGELEYEDDEKTIVKNCEVVAPRIGGFENSGIYIYDDYIYYASVNIRKNQAGELKNDYVAFYSAKLNGSKDKLLFITSAAGDSSKFTFTKIGDTVYLISFDSANLVIVNANNGKVVKSVTDVSSAGFNIESEYYKDSHSVSNFNKYVYYTRAQDDENASGNVFAKANIETGVETVIDNSTSNTYSVIDVKNNNVYYSKKDSNYTSGAIYMMSEQSPKRLTYSAYTSTYVLQADGTSYNGLVSIINDKLYYVTLDTDNITPKFTMLFDSACEVYCIKGNYVYFNKSDSQIYKVDVKAPSEIITLAAEDNVVSANGKQKVSLAGGKLFFFNDITANETTTTYLYLIDMYKTGSNEFESQFIGKLKE